jgi:hypothetical protein
MPLRIVRSCAFSLGVNGRIKRISSSDSDRIAPCRYARSAFGICQGRPTSRSDSPRQTYALAGPSSVRHCPCCQNFGRERQDVLTTWIGNGPQQVRVAASRFGLCALTDQALIMRELRIQSCVVAGMQDPVRPKKMTRAIMRSSRSSSIRISGLPTNKARFANEADHIPDMHVYQYAMSRRFRKT